MTILCWLIGHKAVTLVDAHNIVTVRDALDKPLYSFMLCERCRCVFWE